ncbi:hypothetical protein LEP1GSC198_2924 [Leptospira kirschneri str. JB]|uniref:hypothetical protein n=1 Tax=Leptospira kirschneri TaxID=29507 RepID=UPI0002BFDBD5|nr:hypothetical protein [Leptospira kirschneri]EMJ96460.1 hypothetical protein LEP1GSC198_2924 [Leptospira kirschneri str. JB]
MSKKEKALIKFNSLINEIEPIRDAGSSSSLFAEWKNDVTSAIRYFFGNESPHLLTFNEIGYMPMSFTLGGDNRIYLKNALNRGLNQAKGLLKSIIKEITNYWEEDQKSMTESVIKKCNPIIDQNKIFAIMSFEPEMEHIYEGMRAAGLICGLEVIRVKDEVGDYKITDKIIELITKSKFVIADLTNERPNVYFELGFARGIEKRVITTAKKGTNLHFDVKDWTCIFYNDSREIEKELVMVIKQYLKEN